MYYVYILYSEKTNKYCKGQTANLNNRIYQHNNLLVKSTRFGAPWILVAYFKFDDRGSAMILERKLKNLSVDKLKQFIAKFAVD